MFALSQSIGQKCNESIVISGSARSGTTILGRLLHSLVNVEYAFEPPTLFSLMPLIGKLDELDWKLLYETYLYEEFLINAVSGRAINCNRSDDSSIYNSKSSDEIESRLTKSLSKVEADKFAENSVLAYKMPDVVKYLPQLQSYYPGTKFVIATRQAPELFGSMFRKGWFDDVSLQETNNIWPCYVRDTKRVPFWVDENDAEEWLSMDELHRIAHYYIKVNEPLEKIKGVYVFKYGDFMSDPVTASSHLADHLGLNYGAKTRKVLDTVSRQNERVDASILDGLSKYARELVEHYSQMS